MATKHLRSTLTQIIEIIYKETNFEVAKDIVLDHLSSCEIKEIDRKKMIYEVENNIHNINRLQFYLTNSMFMFEGLGLNKKTKI